MWLDRILYHSPLQALSHQYYSRYLTILAYHDINYPERFLQQIQYVVQKMHPVSLEDVLTAVEHKRDLPQRAVLVTFDDGYRSVFEVAMPILQQYQVPGIVFVVTGLLDTDHPFWWDEVDWLVAQGAKVQGLETLDAHTLVRTMKRMPGVRHAATMAQLRQNVGNRRFIQPQLRTEELRLLETAGIMIGNHTRSHQPLDSPENAVDDEIIEAHRFLVAALGHSPKSFAYPYGFNNPHAHSILQNLGYELGFLFNHRIARWPIVNPMQTARLRVNAFDQIDRFRIVLSGVHPTIHHMIGRN